MPQLKKHNVRLIGVGPELLGLQDFLEGKFFDGELFVDESKESYEKLGFDRMSLLEVLPAIFSRNGLAASYRAMSMNLGGNMWGDGYQKGGCLVVGKGGTPTIFAFKQEEASEHPANEDILKALKIQTAD